MDTHIHITGSARSGTTLMLELMRACYGWDYAPRHETRYARALPRRFGRTLTKAPADGPLDAMLGDPGLLLIALIRDPRDIVVSRHFLGRNRYWWPLDRAMRCRRAIAAVADRPNCLVLRYEDLVADPDAAQQRIETQAPWLGRRHRFSEFHRVARVGQRSRRALHGVRPISIDRIGAWRNDLPRVAGEIARHGPVGEALIADGYETDDAWMAMLDDVVPDLEPTVTETRREWKRKRRRQRLRLDPIGRYWVNIRERSMHALALARYRIAAPFRRETWSG